MSIKSYVKHDNRMNDEEIHKYNFFTIKDWAAVRRNQLMIAVSEVWSNVVAF